MAKYFKISEFDCKCGCGKNNIDDELVKKLDRVREKAGIPIVVSSGCRCEKHNKEEGGKENSAHLSGLAVDMKAISSGTRWKLMEALFTTGFNRIGMGKTFIHADIDIAKSEKVMWLY